jgi:hypothetical protein
MDQQQDGQPEAPKRRKLRWRYTLRELLVIVTLGSVLSGWVAVKVRRTTRNCGEWVRQVVAKGNFGMWNIGLAIDEQGYPHISYVEFNPYSGFPISNPGVASKRWENPGSGL